MNLVELDRALRQLRLSGMASVLETRLRHAQTEHLAPLEQAVLPTQEFVGDERRHEIDRRQLLGLGVAEAGFEDGRHAREAEFPEGVIELDEIHTGSPVLRSMRSR